MNKTILFIVFALLTTFTSIAQVYINELDTDTPSTDDREFIELRSDSPNFSLDDYVLVLFNGSTSSSSSNRSYFAIDLDGATTDANGIFVIGNNLVSPVPEKFLAISTIQNGADAAAIYLGSAADFPDLSLATTNNLVDALAYDTSDADATELMTFLGVSVQINEDEFGMATSHSIQRKNDGTYEVKIPTPGARNDGTGIIFNGISISTSGIIYNEGDTFSITFTTQTPVGSTTQIPFTITNGSFVAADFTGNLSLSIPAGSNSVTTTIQLVQDGFNDGDEIAKIRFGTLASGFIRLNDNIEIRIIDLDFVTQPWGTPLNPTFGIVSSTAPSNYYSSLEGKSGALLKQAVQDIIADPNVVHAQNYGDIEFILKDADQNPLNSNEVWLMYVEEGRSKYRYQTSSSNVGSWNREHIFPQSRGLFANGTESVADGINIWLPTNADDILAGHADAHHLRAEDGPENTRRSNKDYGLDDYNGPLNGTQGSWHGDVARSLFYMACRYNSLSLANGNLPDTTASQLGDLATLLIWNKSDPSDDFEMNRNNVIYTWQINRNPFIDLPELADYIWGDKIGDPWFAPLSDENFSNHAVGIYPNPASNEIKISGITTGNLTLFSITGMKIYESVIIGDNIVKLHVPAGIYIAKIISDNKSIIKKLIIK